MKVRLRLQGVGYLVCGLVLIGSIVSGHVSEAATFYIVPSGNDAGPGTKAQPFRTINKGVSVLKPGDTLYIRAGTYNENVAINTQTLAGTAAQPIVIAGYPGDTRPVVHPPNVSLPGFSISWFTAEVAAHITLRDFEINGIDQPNNMPCLRLESPHILAENLVVRNCARNGVDIFSSYITVRNAQIYDCGRIQPPEDTDTKGIGVYFGDFSGTGGNGILENSLIDGCRGGGLVSHYDEAQNNIFRNNIIRNYGLSSPHKPPPGFTNQYGTGITIGAGSGNAQAYNNIIYNGNGNGSQAFVFWGSDNNLIANNTIHNVDVGYWTLCSRGATNTTRVNNIYSSVGTLEQLCAPLSGRNSNNLTTNPQFVNAAAGDFHLQAGSAAIDAGMMIGEVSVDFGQIARPQGLGHDIGAYEYAGGKLPAPANFRMLITQR